MLPDAMLALGLSLATASQLRFLGGTVGPGEICLIVWVMIALTRETWRLGPVVSPILGLLLAFWTVFALSLGLGAMMGLATEEIRDTGSMFHDAFSYGVLAAFSCLCVVQPGAEFRVRRIAWWFVTLGSAWLAAVLANAWGAYSIPGVEPWFFERLQGWSENPNQLALICTALGLASLHLVETSRRVAAKLVATLCGVLPVVVGRMSGSDTFSIIMLVAGPVFIALKLRAWLLPIEGRLTFRSATAWTIVLALPLLLASTVLLAASVAIEAEDVTTHVLKNGGKESSGESKLRFALWDEAFTRGIESGMVGLGPGAHLVSTPYKRVPPPNFEAHNTLLDLFTQGGLLAVASFVGVVATGLFLTYRANLAGLTVLLGGFAIFSMFHLVVRHPVFWFVLTLCLVSGSEKATLNRYRS